MDNFEILSVGGDEDDRYLVTNALNEVGCESEVKNFYNGNDLINYFPKQRNGHSLSFAICIYHRCPGLYLKKRLIRTSC